MSWHYLRVLEGEFLEDICLGGEQCVPLKSKITHAVFYCNGKLMDSYLDSLSGTMLEPLTENLGKEKSMLSAVDSHARTSVLRGGGGGLDGARSGLWSEMARVIGEVQPTYAFVENSPMLTVRGLGTVLGDLSEMGYDCRWGVISAADIGAIHERQRIWILAYTNSIRLESNRKIRNIKTTRGSRWSSKSSSISICSPLQQQNAISSIRDDDVVASRVDRLKAIGNGQVPLCAATAWRILSEIH